MAEAGSEASSPDAPQSTGTVLRAFTKLGLTSFGGPVAHIGYFREEFVARRKWFDEQSYADLVALAQFLPGPTSSQVGIGIGLTKAGIPGALAAWFAFTLPSALIMLIFGLGVLQFGDAISQGWLHGLKVAAVAVVAQAVWGMARTLCPDGPRATIGFLAAIYLLLLPSIYGQFLVILVGGLAGAFFLKASIEDDAVELGAGVGRGVAVFALVLFFALLIGLPVLVTVFPNQALEMIDSFYRSGSLVFGGGHVVLPLLQNELVPPGWVSNDNFLAGYGVAQAVPGPMFAFAAFLGAVFTAAPNGWVGGVVALVAVFVPSFLLVIGVLPFWDDLRKLMVIRRALNGVNAAIVGLLAAAFYNPVWTSAVKTAPDFALALAAFGMLTVWKTPPWLVVILSAVGGWGIAVLGL